jgi:hypothetical protein
MSLTVSGFDGNARVTNYYLDEKIIVGGDSTSVGVTSVLDDKKDVTITIDDEDKEHGLNLENDDIVASE